ncbi:hypothetical protein AB8Q18_07695 [Neisseriaceae bacterium CLB008]
MTIKVISVLLLCSACTLTIDQPPRTAIESWKRHDTTREQVGIDLKKCGLSIGYNSMPINLHLKASICMENKGYYLGKPGDKTCNIKHLQKYEACGGLQTE